NVGIVLAAAAWRERLRSNGATATTAAVLALIPAADDDPVPWTAPKLCDTIEGASPVATRVAARSGRDWLLVGDAAGFLDPFTGEGLHRALRSAELAVAAVDRHLDGDASALGRYEHAMTRLTGGKNAVSLVVQAFLGMPPAF